MSHRISTLALLALLSVTTNTQATERDYNQNLVARAEYYQSHNQEYKAILLYETAAQTGNSEAQEMLGQLYLENRPGNRKDETRAIYWLEKASENNMPK